MIESVTVKKVYAYPSKGGKSLNPRANLPPLGLFLGYYLCNYEVDEPSRRTFG